MTGEQIRDAHNCSLWQRFAEWAGQNGVDPNGEPDDWFPWWKCFLSGAESLADEIEKRIAEKLNKRRGKHG